MHRDRSKSSLACFILLPSFRPSHPSCSIYFTTKRPTFFHFHCVFVDSFRSLLLASTQRQAGHALVAPIYIHRHTHTGTDLIIYLYLFTFSSTCPPTPPKSPHTHAYTHTHPTVYISISTTQIPSSSAPSAVISTRAPPHPSSHYFLVRGG